MKRGRPTKYNEEILELSERYLKNFKEIGDKDEVIPSIAGLALYLDIRRNTIYDWSEKYPVFSNILDNILKKQESLLVNKGLSSEFNSNITKLVLGKHGYKEQTDITTKGKSVNSILQNVRSDNSNTQATETEEED